MQTLQTDSLLQGGRYRIIQTIGQGGFGITYLAFQSGLERNVAIKEFFMKELCERDASTSHVTIGTEGSRETVNRFREKFLKEARNIAKLNHPNIVRIIDVFEENGTAYYVMEYAENGSLSDKLKREGYLTEPVATRYILQVADALDYIHQQKMNHLDVKPANIMLNEKDESVLIDFGLSKQYDSAGSQTSTTPVGISEGYAPMEQYMQGGVGVFSPETDIYALGATFYKLLTGITPPNASLVNNEGLPLDELKSKGVSTKAIKVISKAMEGRKKDRTNSICAFVEGLNPADSPIPKNSHNESDEVTRITRNSSQTKEYKEEEKNADNTVSVKETPVDSEATVKPAFPKPAKQTGSMPKKGKLKVKALICGIVAVAVAIVIGVLSFGGLEKQKEEGGKKHGVSENKKEQAEIEEEQMMSSNIVASYSNGILKVNDIEYKMIPVEGGTFKMGATPEQLDFFDNGTPVHTVTLSDFCIGETEVTQELWDAVMDTSITQLAKSKTLLTVGNNCPMCYLSWNDCQDFIKKLNEATGKKFRLPTEAEWEFAARGGNLSRKYKFSGSNRIRDVGWYGYDKTSTTHTIHPVKQKKPNELGIYDMSGNVEEWCQDWYGSYEGGNQTNPKGPASGTKRVTRGGHFLSGDNCCYVADRFGDNPHERYDSNGFRLCLSESTPTPNPPKGNAKNDAKGVSVEKKYSNPTEKSQAPI